MDTCAPVPLGPLLTRLAGEAEELAALTERAEDALHAMLDGRAGLPAGVGQDLQRIDLVRQSLQDMARLLSSAALQVPEEACLPADAMRRALRLASFSARLTGAHGIGALRLVPEQDDIDLF